MVRPKSRSLLLRAFPWPSIRSLTVRRSNVLLESSSTSETKSRHGPDLSHVGSGIEKPCFRLAVKLRRKDLRAQALEQYFPLRRARLQPARHFAESEFAD